MPEPTRENKIKLGLLQNNLISIEQYGKTYIAKYSEEHYALLDLPNINVSEISEEEFDELCNNKHFIYHEIIVLPESELSNFNNYLDCKIFYFKIDDVSHIFMIDDMYNE